MHSFSRLQEINRAQHEHNPKRRDKQAKVWAQAVRHFDFCIRIYRYQLSQGRHFLHEHPYGASSWNLDSIRQLLRDPRVQWTRADQCEYGLKTYSDEGVEMPAQKSTCFMTSSWALADELSQRCRRDHVQQDLLGKNRAKDAAKYPDGLVSAICRGLVRHRT